VITDPKTTSDYQQLAELLFPEVTETPATIVKKFPPRQLDAEAQVTRFAPSPTGFIHIGGILTALLDYTLTKQSKGVYILRIEDTDQQRQIERGVEEIVEALAALTLEPTEGPVKLNHIQQIGNYGPYIQSERKDIYQAFAKDLVGRGLAYPCFMTTADLEQIHAQQEAAKVPPGIYGEWAQSRALSLAQIKAKLDQGASFVIRVRANANYPTEEKVVLDDLVKGRHEMPVNDKDSIILKSDGLPTYHLAHPIDDLLMQVNLVIRGDEWFASVPLHLYLFEIIAQPLGLTIPRYAHIAPIAKLDGNSKRKISKRKDPEAAMSYYYEQGYPIVAVLEYLLNLANSNFEDWRLANPTSPYSDFEVRLERLGKAMPLFDWTKLNSISRNVVASYSAAQVLQYSLEWATQYKPALAKLLKTDLEYSHKVLNVERSGVAPRKDIAKWSELEEYNGFFFEEIYQELVPTGYANMPDLKPTYIIDILDHALSTLAQLEQEDKESWLARMRVYAIQNGYAAKAQELKKNPGVYKGWYGDVMMVWRVALSGKRFTPDMYEIISVLGTKQVAARLEQTRDYFLKIAN
jgi:glutamyl-tRNA synthetase